MKVNHATIISSVEFNDGSSVSVGDWLEGEGGMVVAINMGIHADMVQVVVQDGDEGYAAYFNEDGDEVSEEEFDGKE